MPMNSNQSDIRAWVLDVDDTVYLERDYVQSGFNAVGDFVERIHGVSGYGAICWSLFQSGVRGQVFDQASAVLGAVTNAIPVADLVGVYRSHRPTISCDETTIKVLKILKETSELAIITGGPEEAQRQKVAALGLSAICEKIVFAGARGSEFDKPHPWAWQEIEEKTGFQGTDLIYVGDNPNKDFQAPLKLGWRTIRIRLKESLHESLPTPQGVIEVNSIDEITQTFSVN